MILRISNKLLFLHSHVILNNLSSEQAYEISKRIFQKWQEAEEKAFYNKMGRVINIYQKNQISNIKYCLRNWLCNARKIKIEQLERSKSLNTKKLDFEKGRSVQNLKAQKYESERLSNYNNSESIPEICASPSNKARSVLDILSSRNIRNKNRSSQKHPKAKTRLTMTEIDEDMIRDPPVAYNPFKNHTDDNVSQLSDGDQLPIYERLHEDAKLKEAKIREYELIKKEEEIQKCTFKPSVSKSRGRSASSRFEELAQPTKKSKEEMYRMRRESKEVEGCTFQPNITWSISSVKNSTFDGTKSIFNKLYEENEAKKRYRRNLEIENESKQIQGCTFKPQTFSQTQSFIDTSFSCTTPKSSNGEVFNRLYSEHSNLKRKKIKQEIDKKQEEDTKYSFHPERVTRFKDKDFGLDDETSSPNKVYEKLYKDAEIHNSRLNLRQRAAQRELQEMSRFSCLSYRTSGKQFLIT